MTANLVMQYLSPWQVVLKLVFYFLPQLSQRRISGWDTSSSRAPHHNFVSLFFFFLNKWQRWLWDSTPPPLSSVHTQVRTRVVKENGQRHTWHFWHAERLCITSIYQSCLIFCPQKTWIILKYFPYSKWNSRIFDISPTSKAHHFCGY